ncbi:MAG: hypothetical protein EOM80_17240 [Erysipelotrichia bacterium]|nr:hypothetical protein [Erysipelotrichia bacterium]
MNYMAKRSLLILCVMLPSLLISEAFGYNTTVISALTAGISSGISVVLFPDPEHIRRIEAQQKHEQEEKE